VAAAREGTVKIVQGNGACVEGALIAGCRFYAGYPITPSSEIAEEMARRLPLVGGICLQMEDELASINALAGAAWGGWKAMTATSGPGFCLMQEGIGMAASMETPCVIVNVQRGGPGSGQSTAPAQGDVFQARYGSNGDYPMISLAPSDAQEFFDLTIRAFNLSEKFRTPVTVMADEMVGHTRESIYIPPVEEIEIINRKYPTVPKDQFLTYKPDPDDLVPPMPAFNDGYRCVVTSQVHSEGGWRADGAQAAALIQRLIDKVERQIDYITDVESQWMDDAEMAVISYGAPMRSAIRAVINAREAGLKVGWMKLRTLWPFPQKQVQEVANKVKWILVPEMNVGRMSLEVERVAHGACEVVGVPKIGGRCHTPGDVFKAIRETYR
jgi:2-oxoglutarate ferredoxin oxidoreductase subunit alpha